MKTIFFSLLILSALNAFAGAPLSATGKVLRMDAAENAAILKVQGYPNLLKISKMTDFSQAQLKQLTDSQETGSVVKLKVNSENQIVDIEKP